ncbi:hypothetical protein HOP50_05g38150 [Chloropicon primus]|nr:hypothetical protein HOP50_05g38150 [Chloropicon primus]
MCLQQQRVVSMRDLSTPRRKFERSVGSSSVASSQGQHKPSGDHSCVASSRSTRTTLGSSSLLSSSPSTAAAAAARGSKVQCSAGPASSNLGLKGLGAAVPCKKPTLSRAWLNQMVPDLVNKVNKSTHSSHARRGDDTITMAFVCNEALDKPLTRVFQERGRAHDEDASSEGAALLEDSPENNFHDWSVILEEVDAMQVKSMAGILVVKPLFDESNLKCPAGKDTTPSLFPHADLRGSVGDCCGDEDFDFADEVVFESNVLSEYNSFNDIYADKNADGEPLERSYGVVLQSCVTNPVVDGCYILRTSTSRSVGCTCTHYSMSRALCGLEGSCLPVQEQMDKAWLVNPFTN